MTMIPDFSKSYFRFYIDFEGRQAISLSHKPPTRTNRTRITLESICEIVHRPTKRSTTYALSAACKTEQVGAGKNALWLMPNADVIFVISNDGQAGIIKSWHKNNPGVMRFPESLGPQPERMFFRTDDNFDAAALEVAEVEAAPLTDFDSVTRAILGSRPIISRIAYADGEFDVRIDQPVKTINIAERDELMQTDTGPIIVPDLSPERVKSAKLEIEVFDLAYSAWHRPDWAEFIINAPMAIGRGVSANHYSRPRHVEPTRNTLFVVGNA